MKPARMGHFYTHRPADGSGRGTGPGARKVGCPAGGSVEREAAVPPAAGGDQRRMITVPDPELSIFIVIRDTHARIIEGDRILTPRFHAGETHLAIRIAVIAVSAGVPGRCKFSCIAAGSAKLPG